MDHVRTQLPYAFLVAAVTILLGDVATAFGLPAWAAIGLCAVVIYFIVRWKGKVIPEGAEEAVSGAVGRTLEGDSRTARLERLG